MPTTRRFAAALLGVVVMGSASTAHAQLPPGPHFTFTVPLQLANLPPEITTYEMSCSVGTLRSLLMATGFTIDTIIGGAVNTNVVVNVTVTNARDFSAHPANATHYACNLVLSNGRSVPYRQYLPTGGTALFPLSPTAAFMPWARGTIPR